MTINCDSAENLERMTAIRAEKGGEDVDRMGAAPGKRHIRLQRTYRLRTTDEQRKIAWVISAVGNLIWISIMTLVL